MIIPDWNKSINEEGIAALGKPRQIWFFNQLEAVAQKFGFDFDTPLKNLTEEQKNLLLNGSTEKISFTYNYGKGKPVTYLHRFSGVINYLKNFYSTTSSNHIREWVEAYMNTATCQTCNGGRLKKESLSVKFQDKNISEVTKLSISRGAEFFSQTKVNRKRCNHC